MTSFGSAETGELAVAAVIFATGAGVIGVGIRGVWTGAGAGGVGVCCSRVIVSSMNFCLFTSASWMSSSAVRFRLGGVLGFVTFTGAPTRIDAGGTMGTLGTEAYADAGKSPIIFMPPKNCGMNILISTVGPDMTQSGSG